MAKTFKFKSDEEIVNKASDIFEKLGLSLDQAVNLFLRQSILQSGLPFRLVLSGPLNELPDTETDSGSRAENRENRTEQDAEQEGVIQPKAEQQEKQNRDSPLFEQMKTNLFNEKNDSSSAETRKAIEELRNKLKSKIESCNADDKNEEFASRIKESVAKLQEKLNGIASEAEMKRDSEDAGKSNEQIKESLSKLKDKLSERFTNETKEDESVSEEKLSKIEEQITKDFSAAESGSASKIKESLDAIKSRLSENFDKKQESAEDDSKSVEQIRNSLSALKSRISENFSKAEEQTTDTSEIRNSVAELKNRLSENFSKAENAQEEEIPTVSAIVNESEQAAPEAKSGTEKPEIENEEDEDETTPDGMFDKWGQDESSPSK